jgi:hypothetical protein
MNITAKNLRKTIMLGGMSVDDAAKWCEKSLDISQNPDEGWFNILVGYLVQSEGRDLEFIYYPDDADEESEDYLLELPECSELPAAFYSSSDYGNVEHLASTDCDILNKFIRDFYA